MIEGLKILLERMKTHPEEFLDDSDGYVGSSKWGKLIHRYNKVLTKEEIKAFNDALHELHRQQFTADVLESLISKPVELDPETYTIKTAGRDPWGSQKPYAYDSVQAHDELHRLIKDEIQKEQMEQLKQIMKDELQQATKKRSR